ncbi:MAG TPA: hypothetical protein VMH04_14580 [Candidatus Solibacter sp.]|nr:hypothetical protein [Candidatus Solibacter sp.]
MLFCAGFFCRAAAQEDRPQIFPGERKAPRKKDAGPRALAVLQMAGNGKVTAVPVAILVNGKFYDATAYKADPVPMALDSGTVYEGERTGSSLGLFTVGGALHSNAVNAPDPWLGTGNWRPTGTEPAKEGPKAEITPLGIDKSDEPPRLTKNPDAARETKPAAPASTPAPASPPSSSSGDEPPRLTKPATTEKPSDMPQQPQASGTATSSSGSTSPSQSTTNTSSAQPASKSGDSKPTDTKTSDNKPAETKPASDSKTPDSKTDKNADAKTDTKLEPKPATSDSGAGEANRPRLRRGKPAESFADEEVPGYSKFGAKPKDASAKLADTSAAKGPIDLVPAISDASGPEPRSYSFEWLKGEEEDRRKQMMELAKEQLRAYLAAQAKSKTAGEPPAKSKAVSKKIPEPIFGTVKMVAYDLWASNQPVIVFTADAHMPPAPAGVGQSAYDTEMQYSIVLVAYPDTYENLRKIYGTVTDKFHLDLTPRLQLIDAVDADGDGRGELLFRETSDIGTGWVVYRASADKLWKLFDSLNPE